MNPSRPQATHVAVRDGRILGVGTLADLAGWGPHTLDERFASQVLMPGLVEGHSHLMAGTLWRYTYCGYFDLRDPDGRNWPGAATLDAVVGALSAAETATSGQAAPVVGWGFDPIYFGSQRCTRGDLDRVSTHRAVGVLHASGHILNVNTAALELAGLHRAGIAHPGIPLGADGLPTGELKGPDAMGPLFEHLGLTRSCGAIRSACRATCPRGGPTPATARPTRKCRSACTTTACTTTRWTAAAAVCSWSITSTPTTACCTPPSRR